MNEKIKELAAQSNLLIKKNNGDQFRYGYFDPKLEKFAELIIKQCLGIYESIDNGNHVMGTFDYPEAVVKYFGME